MSDKTNDSKETPTSNSEGLGIGLVVFAIVISVFSTFMSRCDNDNRLDSAVGDMQRNLDSVEKRLDGRYEEISGRESRRCDEIQAQQTRSFNTYREEIERLVSKIAKPDRR